MRAFPSAILVLASICGSACGGPTVDLTSGLRIADVSTGWLDAGRANGLNKLVPTVSFTLTNVSGAVLPLLQVNAVFRRAGQESEWGARFATAADPKGLVAGASTRKLTLSSDLGYTGADPRDEMLRNAQFVDVDVDLFCKYSATQWVRLGRYPVRRQLVAAVPQ